jgi:hypothetical protein
MLHVGKNTRGYILNGYMDKQTDDFVPRTCLKAYWDKNMGIQMSKKDLSDMSFAHGDVNQLLAGKMCVVRGLLLYPITSGTAWWKNDETYYYADLMKGCVEKYVLHLCDGGVLIIIGITPNRNTKVVYKP